MFKPFGFAVFKAVGRVVANVCAVHGLLNGTQRDLSIFEGFPIIDREDIEREAEAVHQVIRNRLDAERRGEIAAPIAAVPQQVGIGRQQHNRQPARRRQQLESSSDDDVAADSSSSAESDVGSDDDDDPAVEVQAEPQLPAFIPEVGDQVYVDAPHMSEHYLVEITRVDMLAGTCYYVYCDATLNGRWGQQSSPMQYFVRDKPAKRRRVAKVW